MAWERLSSQPALPTEVLVPPMPDPQALLPIRPPVMPAFEGDVAQGEALYRLHSRRCHGGSGAGYLAPRLARAWPVIRADLYLQHVITHGIQGTPMRAWAQSADGPLNEADAHALVIVLLTWSNSAKSEAASPAASATTSVGPGVWGLSASVVVLLASV